MPLVQYPIDRLYGYIVHRYRSRPLPTTVPRTPYRRRCPPRTLHAARRRAQRGSARQRTPTKPVRTFWCSNFDLVKDMTGVDTTSLLPLLLLACGNAAAATQPPLASFIATQHFAP